MSDERTWSPSDGPVLPDVPASAYPPGAVELPVEVEPPCVLCRKSLAVGPCCSSHQHDLCHRCYRITHFVELCVPGCEACGAEGLPQSLYPTTDARSDDPGCRGTDSFGRPCILPAGHKGRCQP